MSQRKTITMFITSIVVIGVVLAFVQSGRKKAAEQRSLAEFEIEQKARASAFASAMDDLESQKLITNAKEFKDEFSRYEKEDGRTYVVALATSAYYQNPVVGIRIFEELCLGFYNNVEMGEWIAEDINSILYKDRSKFAASLAKLAADEFQCLPRHIDMSWTEDNQVSESDSGAENLRLVQELRTSSNKDHPNVRKLIAALEGA